MKTVFLEDVFKDVDVSVKMWLERLGEGNTSCLPQIKKGGLTVTIISMQNLYKFKYSVGL